MITGVYITKFLFLRLDYMTLSRNKEVKNPHFHLHFNDKPLISEITKVTIITKAADRAREKREL